MAAVREFECTESQGYEPQVFSQISYLHGKVPKCVPEHPVDLHTVLDICENKLHSE